LSSSANRGLGPTISRRNIARCANSGASWNALLPRFLPFVKDQLKRERAVVRITMPEFSSMNRYNPFQATSFNPERAWADTWHLWRVMVPRRSITGRLLWGKVWRRHDGRRWIYKKFVEYEPDNPV
jgi:hypothetical protein